MELDHIFLFTESPLELASLLHQFGLTEGAPNIHPGQGTACKRFFFHNAYLELVWVTNEEEIKSTTMAKTKLWECSQYKFTGYCPFGICFRSQRQLTNDSLLIFEDGWKYTPPYLDAGLYINVASNADFFTEPMLFEMPFFRMAPDEYSSERLQPLNHEKGFKEITKVILTLPTRVEDFSNEMKKVVDNSIVTALYGKNYALALEFDNCKASEAQQISPSIPLTLRW